MDMCQSLLKEMDKLQMSYKSFLHSSSAKVLSLLSVVSELESEIEKTEEISGNQTKSLYSLQLQVSIKLSFSMYSSLKFLNLNARLNMLYHGL